VSHCQPRKIDRNPTTELFVIDTSLVGDDRRTTPVMSVVATAPTYVGRPVMDQRGRRIGTVQRVHVNKRTGQPEWITVRTDGSAATQHVVPLAGSTLGPHDLRLPFGPSIVRRAPPIADADDMNAHDQFALYSYYLQNLAPRSHD
jgi:sporulation protein YlmC with PRC-barrel domain